MAYTYSFKDFYCSGPWAVVDAFYGCIWINVPTLELARKIRDVFAYKINPAIIDISKSPDYEPNLIDDSVCLDWNLEIGQNTVVETLPQLDEAEHASYTQDGTNLVNIPVQLPLGKEYCQEIQDQIRSFIMIDRILDHLEIPDSLYTDIKDCYSIEMNLEDIQQKLCKLARESTHVHARACLIILANLGGLYD
jgi:hypothetical protein